MIEFVTGDILAADGGGRSAMIVPTANGPFPKSLRPGRRLAWPRSLARARAWVSVQAPVALLR
jgi:hypothetical protein